LITTLNNLKGELENKEQYIVDRGFLEPSRLSYYCDRIARSVPVSIELNRMRINPITGKLKTGEDVEMQKGVITIQGLSSDNIVLNSWIGSLKQMPCIQSIRLENYVRKKSNEPGLFSLIIKF
jgi:Tfp pilus assembly protein PilN